MAQKLDNGLVVRSDVYTLSVHVKTEVYFSFRLYRPLNVTNPSPASSPTFCSLNTLFQIDMSNYGSKMDCE